MKEKQLFINTENIKLWTEIQGKGIPVILLHGGPGFYDYLKPISHMIDDIAFTVRFDQRGCGRSEEKPPYDLGTYFKDIEKIGEYFKIERWILAGHSWGANLALAFAIVHPERIKGLIYISGTGIGTDWKEEHVINVAKKLSIPELHRLHELKKIIKSSPPGPVNKLQEEHYRLFLKSDLYGVKEVTDRLEYAIKFHINTPLWNDWEDFIKEKNLKKTIKELNTPALLIHGEYDPRPYRITKELSELLPNNRFVLIKNSGHYPWREQFLEVKREMREFIEKF